tara:strand:+ start:58 stop:249 length:192 start_codon:yes stop_codon:yes gene_type:complete
MREAELKTVPNYDGIQGPDTFTRIRLTRDGIIIHELLERRGYYVAQTISRHWVAEGVFLYDTG